MYVINLLRYDALVIVKVAEFQTIVSLLLTYLEHAEDVATYF